MSTAISIPTDFPDPPQAPTFAAEAKQITITDQASYEFACSALRDIKGVIDTIERDRVQMKAGVLAAGRAIDDKAKAAKAPWLEAESALKPRIAGYLAEQERIRREEQRRLEEEARKRAEEEQLAAAIAAEQAGASKAEVDAIVSEAPMLPIPIAPPRVERVAGIATVETWSAEVTDKAAFVRWAVALGHFHLVDISTTQLNQMARAQKGALQIPGVKAVSSRTVRVGGR